MGKPNFSEDFKRDAVHQIAVRGYAVREVSERLSQLFNNDHRLNNIQSPLAQFVLMKLERISG